MLENMNSEKLVAGIFNIMNRHLQIFDDNSMFSRKENISFQS